MIRSITCEELQLLTDSAKNAERQRANLNVHESLDANVQRLFIATQPDTYIRPHRHSQNHKWEFFMVLQGSMSLLLFNEDGSIKDRIELSPIDVRAVEIPPNTWHSYVCREANTVALEIKEGEYIPTDSSDFASWSPAEQHDNASSFLAWMAVANVGDSPS